MESIVEDVEDDRETEGSPPNSQCDENSGGADEMRISFGVNHIDGLSSCGHYQGHNCQAERIKMRISQLLRCCTDLI